MGMFTNPNCAYTDYWVGKCDYTLDLRHFLLTFWFSQIGIVYRAWGSLEAGNGGGTKLNNNANNKVCIRALLCGECNVQLIAYEEQKV